MNQQKMGIGKQISLLVIVVSILVFLCSVPSVVIRIKGALASSSESKISAVTELVYNIVDDSKKKADSGEITEAQAKAVALKEIKNLKYNGTDYVWVTDYNNKFLVHPTIPAGFDGNTLLDKKGKQFIVELTNIAKSGKVGFVKYKWTKPGFPVDKLFTKDATAVAFPEWGWIISTGIYTDEINAVVIKTLFEIFLTNIIAQIIIFIVVQMTFVKRLTTSMNAITEDLASSSSQISEASYHLERGSQKLAEGSNSQAASIQEISATLEETSSMLQNNNANTDEAAVLARQATGNASKSYTEMAQMMKSMDEIKTSSNEISKIIKVIDEIAFQTNILALNAAVEAARAGDAGKGFAVVAEEVRNLAQRSTQSAKDTTELIGSNITLSEEGVEIAKTVYESIAGIDSQAKKVSELLDEISAATNEQSIGVEQIHKAISQMEQVMQSGVQTADDTASASQELFVQTTTMNDIVERMTMLVNGKAVVKTVQDSPKRLVSTSKQDTQLISDNYSEY